MNGRRHAERRLGATDMTVHSLTILGGGNTAFAAAANLTLAGHAVTLCELPAFRHTIEPILTSRRIDLAGAARKGSAHIQVVTTDLAQAIPGNDLLLIIVP